MERFELPSSQPPEPTYEQATEIPEEKRAYEIKRLLKGSDAAYGELVDRALLLKEQYPDAQGYRLFHILLGSTPPEGTKNIDFPGEDSVLAFLEKLAATYQP